MTKVTMPDPVAWVMPEHLERIARWNGAINAKNVTLYHNQGERKGTVPTYTADQSEAYANSILAPTSQALEVAQVALERICAIDRVGECESIAMDALSDISALIPKEDE